MAIELDWLKEARKAYDPCVGGGRNEWFWYGVNFTGKLLLLAEDSVAEIDRLKTQVGNLQLENLRLVEKGEEVTAERNVQGSTARRLQAEVERLRGALEKIAQADTVCVAPDIADCDGARVAAIMARAALTENK